MKIVAYLFITFFILPAGLPAQKNIQLSSPDKSIVFSFRLVNKAPQYSITYKSKPLVENSSISLDFENGHWGNNLQQLTVVFRTADETYELVVGKTKQVRNHYNEVTIPLKETIAPNRQVNWVVRVFNDGVAFRYELPVQQNWPAYTLLDENSTFKLTGNPLVKTLFLPSYTTSHEGEYSTLLLSEIKEDTLMDMPALFEFPGNIFLAITEAALRNYAGMYLEKENGMLVSKLSPLPNQQAIKVKAVLPHHTPWRVVMISDRIGALIESNILTNLNEPCAINDVSWIKPGKTTFPWWNGNVTPDTNFAPGNNFETNKYYIDFCSRNKIDYHSVVEYGLHEWYVNDGANFQPGPHADVTTPVPGLDMKQICDYAKQQGVGVRVWVHWAALYPKLDSAFAIFEQWGLQGMMVDFMDRDDQEMVNIQEEILQKAAAHHLHIQFHGAYKPTGLHRTYPNEFTREGTLNYEVNKWDKRITPDHDINMPFTRMLAGSTDYHLGGFRAVPEQDFKVQYTRPLMMGTRCHMLAMYVVLESYLGMVCDYPAAYEGQPGFEFIRQVPANWDETRVLDAKVGEYVIIARRKNDDWFIGAITNGKARQLSVPFSFLQQGNYTVTSYVDAPDAAEQPNKVVIKNFKVTNGLTIPVQLAAGGGFAMQVKK